MISSFLHKNMPMVFHCNNVYFLTYMHLRYSEGRDTSVNPAYNLYYRKQLMHCNELQYRSNHRRCSVKKVVLRNFVKYKGKHLRLWQKCFPLNFAKFLGTSFLRNTSWRLFLVVYRTHYNSLKCTRSSCENCIQFKSI